jgi:PPM family protein phosphatase
MVNATVKCAGASHMGRVRRNNEDSYYIDAERGIFLVVDGIGGQAAGEKAAEIAVDRVRTRMERRTGTLEQRVREAIAMANNEILSAARSNPEWEGMACVLTLAALENGSAVVGHVGDSRLYHARGGKIRKITHDHSPIGEREDSGELTEGEAMRHPRRNEVFRDVGSEEHGPGDEGFIELLRIPFEPDSALVLCSDGLSDQVPSAGILQALERHAGEPEAAVRELIEAANDAGGKDNVTVLVVEGERFSAAASEPPTPAANYFTSRPAFFLYGLLLALAGAWLSRSVWVPPPVVFQPRTLAAGNGAVLTIADAIAAAREGDTVEVAGGEYREQIKMKTGVAIRAARLGEAILRAPAMGDGPAVLAESVSRARLSGFRILADAAMPLPVAVRLNSANVELDDLEISGAGVGVEIRGGAPALRASSIHDCLKEGVLIIAAQPWLSHNSIQRNKTGVAARDAARPALAANVFDKNPVELPPDISMDDVRARNTLPPAPPASRARPARGAPAQ